MPEGAQTSYTVCECWTVIDVTKYVTHRIWNTNR